MTTLFTRSSFASPADEDAVEVELRGPAYITVRSATDPGYHPLAFTPYEWAAFIRGVKAGEFDLPADVGWPDDAIGVQG